MVHCKRLIVAILVTAVAGTAAAQSSASSKPNPRDEKGYTAYA